MVGSTQGLGIRLARSVAVLFALSFSSPYSVHCQGTVNLANRVLGKVIAPVYGLEACPCTTVAISGNSSNGYPAGCRVYAGPLVAGIGYTAALFVGPLGSSADQLSFVAATAFRDGNGAGFFVSRIVSVPGIAAGERATFQVRAWDNRGGTITTWQQVLADANIGRGSSELFSPIEPLGGLDNMGQNHETLTLEGLTSFNLTLPGGPTCTPLCRPASQSVAEGRTAEFCYDVCGSSCRYQWYFNGLPIANATNKVLILSNVQRNQAGDYFSIIDFTNVSPVVRLTVLIDAIVLWQPRWTSPSVFAFDLTGPAGRVHVIEGSANLTQWGSIGEVTNITGRVTFQESVLGRGLRFYRARTK